MKADDVKYFSAVSVLIEKMKEHERTVLSLAYSLEDEISDPSKLRKLNENMFKLWEEVVKHNCAVRELEELEQGRYEVIVEHNREDS